MSKFTFICSIVVYNPDIDDLEKALNSFADLNLNFKVVVCDNSSSEKAKALVFKYKFTDYIFNNANLGFGKANNVVFNRYKDQSDYFLVMNPDIYFKEDSIVKMINILKTKPEVGLVAPKVLFKDQTLQPVAKRLPDPADLLLRRFAPQKLAKFFSTKMKRYELLDMDLEKNLVIPSASGCFLFLRSNIYDKVNGFDPRYFLYMEDLDICRRIRDESLIVYYPEAVVTHGWERGAHKNLKLLIYMILSVFKYFNKWGWFFDKKRRKLNEIREFIL